MRSNKQQKKGRNHTIIVGALTRLTYMGVLAVLLACAGAAAGATWVVGDSGGAGCVGMPDAEAAA